MELNEKSKISQKNFPVQWSLNIFTKYKRNVVTGELDRANRIAIDFNNKVHGIAKKLLSAGLLKTFIRNTIEYFNENNNDLIIPEWLFDEQNLIIVRLPFSESNEKFSKSRY